MDNIYRELILADVSLKKLEKLLPYDEEEIINLLDNKENMTSYEKKAIEKLINGRIIVKEK